MAMKRSSEELVMRDLVEAWGRARWPDARVVHELVCSECRIDVAFVCPNDLIGVEIKSSKDTLDRLEKQLRVFGEHLPEVWLAIAPKWESDKTKPFVMNEIVVSGDDPVRIRHGGRPHRNKLIYNDMLRLLWAEEARAIAARHQLDVSKRTPLYKVLPIIAAKLTGEEIMRGVCAELRGRNAFWKADAPTRELTGATP